MHTAGIIIEYDPMHRGHLYLLKQVRAELGPETAVIGVMSGNFVQRGDFALLREHARAEAAVRSGMDLVLELPLPWAVSSAERFADGGVQVLLGTGLVTDLAFGSECGDAAALMELTACLDSEIYHAGVRRFLDEGMPFAACRQAVARGILGGEKAALLEGPNNNLGVEYCKALLRRNSAVRPLAVRRAGMSHSGQGGGFAPATLLRRSEGMEWQTGYELTLDCMVYQTDRLVSIAGSYYSYIEGAAHPNTWQMGWTFDLEAGAFVEPEELSEGAALGDAVTAEILQLAALPTEDGPAATEQYWEDYEEIVANWTGYAVFFDGTGMNVVFSPYELACYAAGPQAFHIAYEKLEPGLNQRGRTLLGLDTAE